MLQNVFKTAMTSIMDAASQPPLVIIALSGGIDSVVLLDLVKHWAEDRVGQSRLLVAHLNHGIRGEHADGDESFCRNYSQDQGIEYYSEKVDIVAMAEENQLGLEEAGRLARHRFFNKVAGGEKAIVLTAHHADDQAETILLHLRRGSHRRGLCGMKQITTIPIDADRFVVIARPLLDIPKAKLQDYATEHSLAWRTDASNQDETFERNKIRHSIIPSLEAILPGFRDRLLEKARKLLLEEEELAHAGRELVSLLSHKEKKGRLFCLEPIAFADPERLLYAFRHILEEDMGGRLPYGAVLSRLAVLAESGKLGEALSLPGKLQVRKEQDGLFFFFRGKEDVPIQTEVILPDPPFEIRVNNFFIKADWLTVAGMPPGDDMIDPEVEWFNPNAIRWPLRLRPPEPGERFRPLGAPGSRKLQDVMVDLKLPRRKRSDPRVLADYAGAIWLWPYRIAHRVRLEGTQIKALRVNIREESED